MRRQSMGLALVACLIVAPLAAAEFWDKTEYTAWTKKQCLKLLTDSPWVSDFSFSRMYSVSAPPDGAPPTRTSVGDTELGRTTRSSGGFGTDSLGDREVVNVLQVRVATATPIRMASVRLRMLDQPDLPQAEVEKWLGSGEPDKIVLELSYYARPQGHSSLRDLENFFRQATLPTLHSKTYLAAKGLSVHVRPEQFVPPQGAGSPAVLVFPRFDSQGQPHFNGEEKAIVFHMEIDLAESGRQHVVDVELKPKKMKFQGKFCL